MAQPNITKLFNKFAGCEIDSRDAYQGLKEAAIYTPVLAEMQDVAQKNGLKLRVWFPGSVGTMDYRTDRINVHVEKAADGKYRVSNKFNIG